MNGKALLAGRSDVGAELSERDVLPLDGVALVEQAHPVRLEHTAAGGERAGAGDHDVVERGEQGARFGGVRVGAKFRDRAGDLVDVERRARVGHDRLARGQGVGNGHGGLSFLGGCRRCAGSVTTTVVTVVVPSSSTFVVLVVVCVSSAPSGPVTDWELFSTVTFGQSVEAAAAGSVGADGGSDGVGRCGEESGGGNAPAFTKAEPKMRPATALPAWMTTSATSTERFLRLPLRASASAWFPSSVLRSRTLRRCPCRLSSAR